jgi:FkbM family methyltransferase
MDSIFEGTKYTYKRETFLQGMNHIINNSIRYADMLMNISDDLSREFLAKTIIYRLTAAVECLARAGSFQQHIYFDQSFLPSRSKEDIFIDVGGYCGDTLSSFLKYYGNDYKRYYFFEPERNLVEQAKKLASDDKIIFYQIGIYNKKGMLRFQTNEKGIGAISQEGEISIDVDTIDNIVKEPPTYIKIVVEGSEIEALQGAENTIKSFKPVVAVACYHRPSHLLDLYEYLKKLNENYEFFIRAGFNSLYNTVTLFAVNRV